MAALRQGSASRARRDAARQDAPRRPAGRHHRHPDHGAPEEGHPPLLDARAEVEVGLDQDSGVARSSRAGTKRRVKAGPTIRCPAAEGPMPLDKTLLDALQAVTTATLTTVLLKKGIRRPGGEARHRPAHPAAADALLQEHRGQGGGGDGLQ
jgi:hypothetical protein